MVYPLQNNKRGEGFKFQSGLTKELSALPAINEQQRSGVRIPPKSQGPVLTRMTIIINSILFFHSINLHLVRRTVNLQEGIFKRVKLGKKSFWTFSYDFFVQFGEFVQLDVACPMKSKQTPQTCALSSTASEARSIYLERQGHRSGRSPRPDGP